MRKPKSAVATQKAKAHGSNKAESNRMAYALACAKMPVNKRAAKEAGLNVKAAARIARHIEATGTVADAPRSGRKPVYTPQVLEAAYRLSRELPGADCSGTALMETLVENRILEEGHNVRAFMRVFDQYVSKYHHKRLKTASTSSSFLLKEEDKPLRLEYAKKMLRLWPTDDSATLIFTDETTLEASPHPKSGMTPMLAACSHKKPCNMHMRGMPSFLLAWTTMHSLMHSLMQS